MTRLLREQRDTAIQMAADAVALSAEHADRADGAEARTQELEARWQALKDWLGSLQFAMYPQDVLKKMRELEEGK